MERSPDIKLSEGVMKLVGFTLVSGIVLCHFWEWNCFCIRIFLFAWIKIERKRWKPEKACLLKRWEILIQSFVRAHEWNSTGIRRKIRVLHWYMGTFYISLQLSREDIYHFSSTTEDFLCIKLTCLISLVPIPASVFLFICFVWSAMNLASEFSASPSCPLHF